MKIAYFIKDGMHKYPPCLAQVLYLNDLGVDLTVYHGKNSALIDTLLNERGITHYEFKRDKESKYRIRRYIGLADYSLQAAKIIKKIPDNYVLWFGNRDSFIALGSVIEGRKYVASVLELYKRNTPYDKPMGEIIRRAVCVTCCEKHRAEIMRSWYGLKKTPIVMPNKPYEGSYAEFDEKCEPVVERLKGKFIVLYQGILTKDRPLDKIAAALRMIGDHENVFLVLGNGNLDFQRQLTDIYPNTVFGGYIPSPQHLTVTSKAHLGIANYDYSVINNVFCAPNKIFEYARFAVPMLTSDNIGMTETVGAYGAAECVDFNDIEAIKTGIEKIKANYDFYSQNAKKFYESVDYKECVKKVLEKL